MRYDYEQYGIGYSIPSTIPIVYEELAKIIVVSRSTWFAWTIDIETHCLEIVTSSLRKR